MKQIKIGVIGLGVIVERLINVFNKHLRIEVVNGFDTDVK